MAQEVPIIRKGIVTSVYDDEDGDRIKVHLIPEDEGVENDMLAFPLLPKMLHVKPKINEYVLVITAIATDGHSQRFYIGPVISQPNHMTFDPWYLASTTVNRGEIKAPEEVKHIIGAYPKEEDISIEGRKNAGIQLTENDARIKAGVKVVNNANNTDVSFNVKNPSYVKVKYDEEPQTTPGGKKYQGTASIVSDKIVMIGNNSKDGYSVANPEDLITDDEMKKIIDKAHLLPYGDVLIEFLDLFRNALAKHVHPYVGLPPTIDPETGTAQVMGYNLNKINSDTFRVS